jgi:hypothetical protein
MEFHGEPPSPAGMSVISRWLRQMVMSTVPRAGDSAESRRNPRAPGNHSWGFTNSARGPCFAIGRHEFRGRGDIRAVSHIQLPEPSIARKGIDHILALRRSRRDCRDRVLATGAQTRAGSAARMLDGEVRRMRSDAGWIGSTHSQKGLGQNEGAAQHERGDYARHCAVGSLYIAECCKSDGNGCP